MNEKLLYQYYFEDINNFIFPEVFKNVKHTWELLNTSKKFLDTLVQKTPEQSSDISNCVIDGWVMIGKNTVIEPNVYIQGPVVIGDNCIIRHGALIRPGSIISNNCTLGHGCEVKNSLAFNGAKIQSMTFVGDSVIGAGARVGSGTITANRRFDQGTIGIKIDNEYTSFETDYFGVVLGDYARMGANSTSLPGTHIGPYTWVMPLTRVGGFLPKGKLVSIEQPLTMKDIQIKKLCK